MRKENMDDLESRAIENIHDYLKECLDRNNCKVDLAGAREDINDVSLIHSSLKKYVVRLVNINNFIKQENYFLKKKNEQLIKKCNERDAFDFYKNEKGTRRVHRTHEPIQTHGTHAMCMNEMHKLSDENEFIKYKYEQMLRENLSLNENNAQMNNTLLNMHKHEPHTNGENRKVKIENAFLSQSPNQLWPHQDEGRNILGRRNEIDGNTQPSQVNYMTFEQKINKILKCTRILEDILSMLNKNFKYDEPLMFQKKMNLMEVEKAELIMQNDFLKEKILQIETFILNDPFLVEKFNFFYDSASFNLDPSIRDNLELYKNNSTKMMFHKLRRSQSTNADLKQQLSSEKKKSLIYRTYMYDMREKLKDHLSELLKLNKDQNMNYYNLHQCNDSIHHFSENGSSVPWKMFYDHRNNQEEDELSRREHPEYYNYLSDLSTPNFYRLFKINSSKIDHNEKRLTQSWNRIRELNQDARCFQKRRFEQICRQYEDDAILAELENDMQNEVYYFRIKKLISMRKKELDGMLQSGRRQLASQKRKDSSKLRNEMYLNRMEYKEALRKWLRSKEKTLHTSDNHRNTHLKDDLPSGNRNIDQLNLYIKRKISYQFVKYKHIYEYFVQNKGVCKKQISKEKFINFFNKHILHLQNCDTAQCSYRGTPGDGERRIIKSCQKGKVSHNDESNKKRGSAYVEEDNTQYHDVTLEDHGRRGSHHSEESTLRSYRPRVEPIEAAGRKKGDAKREKQREAKGRKQREIKAVEEKQRKIEAEMVRQRKMEKEKQRKMEKEKHRKMEKKKQRKMEKRKQREMEKDKQREEERASNVDRDPPHTEKQAGEEENHDKSNIHIEPSSDNSQEEKMGRENLKKNDQMSEKFYMPEEHPRRHDSSLEALINTIKNINKNKIQENMTSKSIEDLFTSTNSMDERDQSSLIEESPQKERRASNFSKKDSSQRIVESMKSSKSLDVEPIEGEINKGEGGASDLEEFSFDHVKSDTSNSVDEEDEKKSQFSNLSIEPEKEDHIGGEDNPERVVNRGEWENHVGATAQVPARLSVKQKTIVGGSVPLDEIKRVNTMRGVGVSELIHPEEDAQKEEFESGPGKDSHEGELRKDDVLDEPNRDSDQNELPPNVDQSEIPPNVDQGASPPDEEIMHSIRATDKREKPPPKPFYNENFLESGSEYSEHDLFDNSKYANVKIQAFRQMLHLHDKNVYTFFMNLIVHSKINLVRDYKNKVFNAKVMAGDILEYLLKNYFEADKSSVKGEVRKEGSHMQGHLTEVELKHINEYICNNSNSSSLKTLYHKILFLNNENYESFKNRLLEGGVINLINLFQDEDISNFDKIFDVSFVNFCDIVGISKDTCTYHFNRMDKNYKGKRYIYLRHIFRYLEVERDMKEELHKYNFISMQKKNLIYIHISESFDNVNEFFKSVEKKNKLYISVNEFIYFFSENEKMRVHSYTQEDVISLYYSILFYVYYTNKNKVLQTLEFCGEKKGEKKMTLRRRVQLGKMIITGKSHRGQTPLLVQIHLLRKMQKTD